MADEMDYLNNLIDQGNGNDEVEVEMGLLALCMRKDTAILKIVENKIEENDFTDVRNRTIYGVIIDMFLDNAQIDRITVFSELERRGLADKAGFSDILLQVHIFIRSKQFCCLDFINTVISQTKPHISH